MAEESGPIEQSEHGLSRRQFLKALGASTVGAVAFTGCQPPTREYMAQSRVRLAEDVLSSYENWYATTCRGCSAGCGLIVRVIEGRSKKIEGNPDHPLNLGKVCARGQAVVQEQYHPDRIQGPMRRSGDRGSGAFEPIRTWDEALGELTARLGGLRGRSNAVALVTAPERGHRGLILDRFAQSYGAQWLTLDPVSEAPAREAARRVFGQDALPEFDIEHARYVLSFGADFLSTWLSPVHYGVEYGIFRQGNYRVGQFQPRQGTPRGYLVQVDTRFSMTAANADEWIPARPGSEGVLALAIAQVIVSEGLGDAAGAEVVGGRAALDAFSPERVAQDTGVSAERIRQIARDFASRRPSLALGGGSAGSYTNGTDNMVAILALNLVVGNVGRDGGVRFNAGPTMGPGARAGTRLADWEQLAERLRSKQVEAVLVHGADPVHALPGAVQFREALRQAPFIVSFSSFMDDTTALADLILPSHLPLEDWGDDVPDPGPGFPVVSVQQPVVRPFYDTRGFGDVLLAVADRLGGPVRNALPWQTLKDAIREGADGLRQLNRGSVQDTDFERFWTKLLQRGGWWDQASAPAALGAPPRAAAGPRVQPARFEGTESEFPFHLVVFAHNTLGAGESAHLPWLQATPDPITSAVWQTWVEVNPRVAAEMRLTIGDIVEVRSPSGRVEVPVYVHPAAPPNVLAMPMGQGHSEYGRWARGRGVNPTALLAPLADAATGTLAYGATRVSMTKTGRSMKLPKFEGSATPIVQMPHQEVAKVTRES